MSAPRILALDDDPLFLRVLGDQLTAGGMTFLGLRDPIRAVPSAASFNPDVILVDRHMPVLTGSEVIRALRSFTETAHVPVAVATADLSELEVLRAFMAGAVDVLHKPVQTNWHLRVARLLQELAEMRMSSAVGGPSLLVQRLLAFYRRTERSGLLRLNPETPFEGRALFHSGEFVSAELGPLHGLEALEEMTTFERGTWAFEPESQPTVPVPVSALKAQVPPEFDVLFVDDDPDIRQLFEVQLKRSGFGVEVAEDGAEACQLALARPFDLILADLNMPRLDGWGMLRRLRTDHRTRDVPVVFLSAHDDYRETLRAAHAGAFDYLPKTGRAEEVIDRLSAACVPRTQALDALRKGKVPVRLGAVGPQWLLRRVTRLRLTGRLQCRDGWGAYTVAFREGVALAAKTVTGTGEASGIPAVAALLVSRDATGVFEPGTVSDTTQLAPSTEALLERAGALLNQLESRVTDGKISAASAFDVDEELYELFREIGSDRELMLARAICEERLPPAELSKRLDLPPEEIQEALKELLRRRVITFRGEA